MLTENMVNFLERLNQMDPKLVDIQHSWEQLEGTLLKTEIHIKV